MCDIATLTTSQLGPAQEAPAAWSTVGSKPTDSFNRTCLVLWESDL